MMSQNSHRMMGVNSSTLGKSTEKLSSGLRINRAADDAAGLSISEKMRGQIRGLTQASRNSQDAISVVQTAEGALDEAHSILQRMRELAVQSANDSNVSADRASIQQEVSQLTNELDRIASTTQFNTMNLLDGSFKNKVFHVGANQDQNISVDIQSMSAQGLGLRTTASAADDIRKKGMESISKLSASVASLKGKAASIASATKKKVEATLTKMQGSLAKLQASVGKLTNEGKLKSAADMEGKVATKKGSIAGVQASINALRAREASIKSNGGTNNVDYKTKRIEALEAKIQAQGGVLVNTQESANKAITTINDALTKVSRQRSDLGAIQNRMEHTIKNLDNAAENLQAAESRVRDVDMAKEMSEFTKKNILTQASQAMLAQANQLDRKSVV